MFEDLIELKRRCEAAGYRAYFSGEGQLMVIEPRHEEEHNPWDYEMFINEGLHAEIALRSRFELYRYVEGFDAIWSRELGAVESRLYNVKDRHGRFSGTNRQLLEDVLGPLGASGKERIKIPSAPDLTISVGPCTEAFAVHFSELKGWEEDAVSEIDPVPTVKIEGLPLSTEEEASEALLRIGNSALFEIDQALGVGLWIPWFRGLEYEEILQERKEAAVSLPAAKKEYDRGPLALYWYARSIPELPLAQFLAYYQVLEYYFPRYARNKTLAALRGKLKELFGVVRETDVAGIFDAIRANRRNLLGTEREQLIQTLDQCVEDSELRTFLHGTKARVQFYSSDDSLKICAVGISADKLPSNLRVLVAERTYKIRNRIVHAKMGFDDLEPLLPFDPEVDLLNEDIRLVAFLARKVLGASAHPLRI